MPRVASTKKDTREKNNGGFERALIAHPEWRGILKLRDFRFYAAARPGTRRSWSTLLSLRSMALLSLKGLSAAFTRSRHSIFFGSAYPDALSLSKGVADLSYTRFLRLPSTSVRMCFIVGQKKFRN